MRVVLCETDAQVRQAVQMQGAGGELTLVALTTEAAWACQHAGIIYTKLEDFYCDAAVVTKVEQLFTEALAWVNEIDCLLQQRIACFAEAQFRSAWAWNHVFQCWLGELLRGSLILQRMLEQVQQDTVLYWHQEASAPSWNLAQSHLSFAALLSSMAVHRGIHTEVLYDAEAVSRRVVQPVTRASSSSESWVEHTFSQYVTPAIMTAQRRFGSSRLWQEVRQIYKTGLTDYLISLLSMTTGKGRMLVIGRGYDLDPVVAILRRRGVQVTWLDMHIPGTSHGPVHPNPPLDPELCAALARLWLELEPTETLWKPFESWGMGRPQQVGQQLSFWWHQIIPQLWSGYQRAAKALSCRHYDVVLAMDAGGETLSGAMLQAARMAGVPQIIFQHGSSSRIRTLLWHHFLVSVDNFLVYGPETARLIDRDRPIDVGAKARLIPVGSARLDLLRNSVGKTLATTLRSALRGNDPRPIILYVPTNFGGHGRVFIEQTSYPDISYFELQQRILRLFKNYPGVRLLYKNFTLSNSTKNLVPDFLRSELPEATVVHDLPLTRLMWAVDAIIVDHAITALGEVLLTNKRVVVYDPDPIEGLELPDARDLLRRRAAVATTPDEFEASVRALLEANDFSELEQPNDSFLRAYCTHLNDGRSAERAADEIMRVMKLQ